ncbi:MAG: pyrroline-5-carboxylate reductase [Chlamydiota bacterium]
MKIGIIGCGVMGSAFARQFIKKHQVVLFDRTQEKAAALAKEIKAESVSTMQELVKGTGAVMLAVKPKDFANVVNACSSLLSKETLLLSILSGTSTETLKKSFPNASILRLMPNLALTCGLGVIGIVEEENLTKEVKKTAEELFSNLGLLVWLPENKMEGLTALAGSGPAFIFVVIEAMIESGIAMGLSAKEAGELSLKTIEGAAALLRASGKHPGDLRWQIASPGGTTIAGLNEMEACGVRSGMIKTFLATYKRAKEFL